MLDLAAIVGDVRSGMIPAHVYNDPEIFALERDRVFGRAWVFLAHESENVDTSEVGRTAMGAGCVSGITSSSSGADATPPRSALSR